MMKKILFFGLCLFSLYGTAQTTLEFSKEQLPLSDGSILPYRKMQIEGNQPILVMYLHGGSSCGTDNETQMNEAGIDSIAQYLVHRNQPVVFLVPQCSNRTKGWGGMSAQVKQLFDFELSKNAADKSRIYIFGGSMGGTGTWKMLSLYPNYFAAAMPCAGNPKGMSAENISTTPIYTVMGLADKIMGSDVRTTVETLISQLKALGDDVVFETVEGWTHEITCIQSYSTPRLDWVFCHKKDDGGQTSNLATTQIDTTDDLWYDMNGRCWKRPTTQGIFIHNGKKVVVGADLQILP